MKKFIIGTVGIAVLLIGGALYWNSKKSQATPIRAGEQIEPVPTPVLSSTTAKNKIPTPNNEQKKQKILFPSPQGEGTGAGSKRSNTFTKPSLPVVPSPALPPSGGGTNISTVTNISTTTNVPSVSTATLGERLLSSDSNVAKSAQSELPSLSEDQKTQLAFSILNTVRGVTDPVLQTNIADKAGVVLVHLGPAAFPALIKGLGDPVAVIRMKSAYALGEFGAFEKEALAPLMKNALQDPDIFAKCDAIDAVGKMGPLAEEAIAPFTASLEDPNKLLRFHYAQALGAIGPAASAAIPGLIKILNQDPDVYTRAVAAKSLGQIGPAASTAVPDLITTSKDKNKRLSDASLKTLQQIGTPEALAAVANSKRKN